MKKFLPLIIASMALMACGGKTDCAELTGTFTNFIDARKEITKANFPVKNVQSTPESSWIKRIEYYSCDGSTGYLIIYTTRSEEYIHKNVPVEVWDELSNSSSKGSYYNRNIVNRYVFEIQSS